MRSFHLAIELRRSLFDVGVPDAFVFDMPMELGLELMPIVGSDFFDAERKFLDDVIDEINGVRLRMLVVDFERSNARRVVDSRILKTADILAAFIREGEEFDIHLDVMTRDLFAVTYRVHFAHPRSARQPADAIALQDPPPFAPQVLEAERPNAIDLAR